MMKNKITKTLALAAAVFGLQAFTNTAMAAAPVVVWNKDLANNSTKGAFTMTLDGTTTSASGGVVTMTQTSNQARKGIVVTWTDGAVPSSDMTVVVRYSGFSPTDSRNAMIAARYNSTPTEVVTSCKSTEIDFAYGTTSSTEGTHATGKRMKIPTEGLMVATYIGSGSTAQDRNARIAFAEKKSDGSYGPLINYGYIGYESGGSGKNYDFLSSSTRYTGIEIGGTLFGTSAYHRPGMVVDGVAIYSNAESMKFVGFPGDDMFYPITVSGYASTDSYITIPNVTMESVKAGRITAQSGGAWLAGHGGVGATLAPVVDGSNYKAWMSSEDGGHIKGVQVQFETDGTGVKFKALKAGYVANTAVDATKTPEENVTTSTSWNNGTVATSDTGNGYGYKNFTVDLFYDQVANISTDVDWSAISWKSPTNSSTSASAPASGNYTRMTVTGTSAVTMNAAPTTGAIKFYSFGSNKLALKYTAANTLTAGTVDFTCAAGKVAFDCAGLSVGAVLVSGTILGSDNIDVEGSTVPAGTRLQVTDSAITLAEATVYTATISESKSWNAISWEQGTPPTGATCELTVSAAGCRVNFDTASIDVYKLTLKGSHNVDLVYTKSATTISSIELDGTTTYRKVYPSGGDKSKTAAWEIPADVTYVIEGPESGTADTWTSITVPSGATLLTRGQLAFSTGNLNGGGTLEVATGKLTNTCGSQKIAGHLIIDAGATYEQTSGSDTLAYNSDGVVVDVYGTLSMPAHRWTIKTANTINVYPDGAITGAGQESNGALDAASTTTIHVKKNGGTGGTATISATLRPRASTPAFVFDVEDGMTLLLSGTGVSNYHNGINKTGAGTMKVTGTYNNITGTVNVNGTLVLTGTQLTSGEIALAADGTLECNADTAVTLANTISGSGALTKTGTGTWTLSGTLSYTGTTTVSAGTLTVAENKLKGDVSVGATSTLNITGTEGQCAYAITAGEFASSGTVQLNGTTLPTAEYAVSGNAICRSASATRANPVTGVSQTFTYEYVGEDGLWATRANWWTLADGYFKPYTQENLPMVPAAEKGVYVPTLVDGALFNNKTVSVATIEGYNAMLAVMGGAQVTADTLRKSGGTASEYWVGPNSKLTFTAFGDQDFSSDFNFYVASEEGLTFSAELDSTHEKGARTYNYYLKGAGTVKYTAGVTGGTHKIKQLEVKVGPTQTGKQILKQKLIALGGTSTTGLFSAASDITATCDNPDVLNPTYSATRPTTSANVGTYSIEQESDGVYAYVVAYFEVPTGDIHATVSSEVSWSAISWYKGEEEIGTITDFSQINSAALTVESAGVVTIDNWSTISGLTTRLTIGGSGKVAYNYTGSTLTEANPTWGWNAGWTGTYKLTGFDGKVQAWDPTSYYNSTDPTLSKFEFGGTVKTSSGKSYFRETSFSVGELILTGSITFQDGYTHPAGHTEIENCYTFTKLSGTGTFTMDPDTTASPGVKFKDVSEFTGTITNTSSKTSDGYRIIIGNGSLLPTGNNPQKAGFTFDGTATLNTTTFVSKHAMSITENSTVTIPDDKTATFTINQDNEVITINGTLTTKAIANIGGTENITVGATGTIEFTKSCTGDDNEQAVDYSRITGTGVFKLSDTGFFTLPNAAAKRPATTLQLMAEKTSGVVITEGNGSATSPDASKPTTEIGTLSGTKDLRSDWTQSTGANSRNLRVIQAHNSTWEGKMYGAKTADDRFGIFYVRGKDGAEEKTLTFTNNALGGFSQDDLLNVEASVSGYSAGSVRLASTAIWKGPVTVSGEIMGSGKIQGTATFNSGATLVVEAEGSVLTVNTIASLAGVTVKLPAGVTKAQVGNYTIIKLASATASTLDLGEVTIYSGTEQLGEFDIVIPAGSTDAKPVSGAYYVATIPSDATSPVDFKTLSWSPALPEGDTLPTAAHWTITNKASEVELNIAQNLAANILKIVGASGKNLTLATAASVSSSHYDFSEASGKVTVEFGTGAATIDLAGETELKVMPTATSGLAVGDGKKLVLGWDSSDAYSQAISGAGAVDITGNVTLSANNTFTGALTVQNGGMLKMGTNSCLNNSNAAIVNADGTLDINGQGEKGALNFTLAGGALVNNGTSISHGAQQMASITLTANSTVGGTGNFGLVTSGYNATTLTLNGHTLTKTGSGTFWLCNTTISGTGTLAIQEGTVDLHSDRDSSFTTGTLQLTGGTLAVASGRTLTLANLTVASGTISGSGTITGLTTLKGSVDFSTFTGTITLADTVSIGTEGADETVTLGNASTEGKTLNVLGGTLNLMKDGVTRQVGALSLASGSTLMVSTNTTAAAVQVSGDVNLEGKNVAVAGVLPEAGGTVYLLKANSITGTGTLVNPGVWTLSYDDTTKTLSATKKPSTYITPGEGGDVSHASDVTDSLDINRELAIEVTKGTGIEVTSESSADQVVEAMNQTGANTYKVWESAVLGLSPTNAASQLVISPIQGSSTTKVTLQVPTVNVNKSTGADVTFCFWSKDGEGAWTEVPGGTVESGEKKELDLPEDGVRYYQLRTTITTQAQKIPTVIPSADIVASGMPLTTGTGSTKTCASLGTKTLDSAADSLEVELTGSGVFEGQEYHLEVTEGAPSVQAKALKLTTSSVDSASNSSSHFAIVAKAAADKTVTFYFGKTIPAGSTCKLTLIEAAGNGNVAVASDEGFEGIDPINANVIVSSRMGWLPYEDKIATMQAPEMPQQYRIPAIASDGQGEVIACYDCRYGKSDLGATWNCDLNTNGTVFSGIDIAENYSSDNGKTFSETHLAVDVANMRDQTGAWVGGYANRCNSAYIVKERDIGDVCILYNPNDQKYWMMGITGGGLSTTGTNTDKADVVLYTRERGKDSPWVEWNNSGGSTDPLQYRSVKQQIITSLGKQPSELNKGFLEGPGHGIVTTKANGSIPAGTLVFPIQCFFSEGTHSGAAYSTDGGKTWQATALTDTNSAPQENCIMELDDGSWYMCTKCCDAGYYRCYRYNQSANSWTKTENGARCPSAREGSCLRLGVGADGKGRYAICHARSDRANVVVYFGVDNSSADIGITWDWDHYITIHKENTNGGYSSMCMVDDTTLGILYESSYGAANDGGTDTSGCRMYFTRIDVSDKVVGPTSEK